MKTYFSKLEIGLWSVSAGLQDRCFPRPGIGWDYEEKGCFC